MKKRFAKVKTTKIAFVQTKAMAQGDLFKAVKTALKCDHYSDLFKFGKSGGQFTEEERASLIEEIRALPVTRENLAEIQNLLRVVETSPAISGLDMVSKVKKKAGRELKVRDRKNFRSRDLKRVFFNAEGKTYPAFIPNDGGQWMTPYFVGDVAEEIMDDWNEMAGNEMGEFGTLEFERGAFGSAFVDRSNGDRYEGEECYVDGELNILYPLGDDWGWDITIGYEHNERNFVKMRDTREDQILAPEEKPEVMEQEREEELDSKDLEITDADKEFLRGMGIKGKRKIRAINATMEITAVKDVNAVPEKFQEKEPEKEVTEVKEGLGIVGDSNIPIPE